jgi:hypothetical protein
MPLGHICFVEYHDAARTEVPARPPYSLCRVTQIEQDQPPYERVEVVGDWCIRLASTN